MKKLSYLLIAILFVFNCSKDNIEETTLHEDALLITTSSTSKKKSKKPKVEICHFDEETQSWERLSISENGLNGHAKHANDIIVFDKDGDGFPVMNECGINSREDGLFDCDDEDAQKYPMDMDEDGFIACDDCNDNDASLNPNTVWYADNDGDGYGDSNTSVKSCEKTEGYVFDNTDLDDADSTITDVEPINFSYTQGDAIYNSVLDCVPAPNSSRIYIYEIPSPTQLNFYVDGQLINAMSPYDDNNVVESILAFGVGGYWYNISGGSGASMEVNQSYFNYDAGGQGDAKITLTDFSSGTINMTLDINYLYTHTDGNTYPVSLSYPLTYIYQSLGIPYCSSGGFGEEEGGEGGEGEESEGGFGGEEEAGTSSGRGRG